MNSHAKHMKKLCNSQCVHFICIKNIEKVEKMAKKVKQRKINLKNDTHVENMCEKMRRIEAKINYKTFFQIRYTKKKKKQQQEQ